MLVHSYYEEDSRVRREAEALVASGRAVEVFSLRRPGDQERGEIDGVVIHRLDVQRHQGAGLSVYLREYLSFLVRGGWAMTRAHRSRRYAVVQVHSLPDFLVAAALPIHMTGVPVLLDLHESMPEFFRVRFPRAANPLVFRLLLLQEQLSIGLASHVLTVNEALAGRLAGIGVRAAKITVVPNSPSLRLFDRSAHPERSFGEDGTVRLVYAGALSATYELDVALKAVRRIRGLRPDLHVTLDVYGRDFGERSLADVAAGLGLADCVTFHDRIPLDAVPATIAAADIGLAPTRRDAFTEMSLSTKILEYAAMGKPVVAARLPLVEATFPPGTVATYEPGDADSLAARILELVDDADSRERRAIATAAIAERRSWERESARYIAEIERLASRP